MSERLHVDGRQVAALDLDQQGHQPADHVVVFRDVGGWSVLVTRRRARYDELGELVSGEADVWAERVGDFAALQEYFDRLWGGNDGWRELLDVAHGEDRELYAAWVPQQVDRDLGGASIHNKDLATATSFIGGEAVPAPGRALPQWKEETVTAMAAHLERSGWQVRARAAATAEAGEASAFGDPVLGALVGWRYGWAVAIVVRVDDCGEVFARRADDDEVIGVGPAMRPLSDDEEDQAAAEYSRRRHAAIEAHERQRAAERREEAEG